MIDYQCTEYLEIFNKYNILDKATKGSCVSFSDKLKRNQLVHQCDTKSTATVGQMDSLGYVYSLSNSSVIELIHPPDAKENLPNAITLFQRITVFWRIQRSHKEQLAAEDCC